MINLVKDLFLTSDGKIIAGRVSENYIKKNDKLYTFINSSFDSSYSLSEKIYLLTHDLSKRPLCKTCSTELKFKNGYTNFCSRKCSNADPDVLVKNKTNVSVALKKVYEERGDEVKSRRNATLEQRFGQKVTSPFGLDVIKQNLQEHVLNKFGVTNIFYLKEFRADGKKVSQDRSVQFNKLCGYDVSYLNDSLISIKNLCHVHGDIEMKISDFYNRAHRDRSGIICPICNPISSFSSFELLFEEVLKELNITDYVKRNKSVLKNLELDFYFPNHNFAIELNGCYWHSEIYKDKKYHQIKSDRCNEIDIDLWHIWEDDFYEKRDIIKSMLKNKFGLISNFIYARNCVVREITSKEYKSFLDLNHIQSSINSSIKLGLFYENSLVSVMGFGQLRKSLGNKEKDDKKFELVRFCTILNTRVIGGASKLLSYFEKNFKWDEIISYAKRDHSKGNVYKQLGFIQDKICLPGYTWLVNGKRKHRFNFRKSVISNINNKHLTEIEIMHNQGYYRCFDSGNFKFIKKKQK